MAVAGSGRAGGSFARALADAGWEVEVVSRAAVDDAAYPEAADLVLLCVPDSSVAEVASRIAPTAGRVVAHCSGALGLAALAPAPRRATVHPLASLPDAETGARRLSGGWFAVSGDAIATEMVGALGGRFVEVDDNRRAEYHAAAAIASNHLVGLIGQVERVALEAGVPLDAYRRLATDSLNGAFETSPSEALTGPVARGDWETVEAHLGALGADEREAYLAMAKQAALLAGRELPDFGH
ncbi:MAG: DUF2520 domain-containing protein [Microthrixaceae bacterium]